MKNFPGSAWRMHISSAFDSGNIEVINASNPSDIQLRIRPDAGGDHMQWFHFRLVGAAGEPVVLHITNAGKCSYPKAWNGYQATSSSDRRTWARVPTEYAHGVLTIRHTPSDNVVYYSYFAPFSHERHLDLIANHQADPKVSVSVLGPTVDGLDLELLTFGTGPLQCWVIARQHPGESMAEWFMAGFLARLLNDSDPECRGLLEAATFHVVPNMNPDGSRRGHLRNNASGANLNRMWLDPTADHSPEVLWTRNRMDQTGVDFCLDVHGDEELPYNFISGAEGIEGWTDRLATLQKQFCDSLESTTADFQQVYGYAIDAPGTANMTMCTNQISRRFDCLAMTLEQPFKDAANNPEPSHGWSPKRAADLGRSVITAIANVAPSLR